MSDLATFLLARYGEVEAAAKAAIPGPWRRDGSAIRGAPDGYVTARSVRDTLVVKHTWAPEAAHILLHDPAQVLQEIAAKRTILELHRAGSGQHPDFCWHDKHELPCPTLRALGTEFAGHPDYLKDDLGIEAGSGSEP